MKNTKRYLVATLGLVMLVASMLVFVSCGHKHDYKSTVTKPTCTERGYTTYTCSCGDSYVDSYVDAKHDLVEYSAKNPNCLENGHEAYVACKNCDYTTYKEIPSTGDHYYEKSIVKIPSAEKNGKALYHCDGCGHSYEEEITLRDIELPDLMGAVASVLGDRYYSLDLGNGFNLICIKQITTAVDYEEPEFEGQKRFLAVKLPKAYLEIKDAKLKAELEVEIGEATIDFNEAQNPNDLSFVKFDSESVYYIELDGNEISTKYVCGEEKEEYRTTVYELMFSLVSDYIPGGVSYESVLEVYAVLQQFELFMPVLENISEKIEGMEKADSDADYTALLDLLAAFGGNIIEKSKDGEDTVYSLELENLSKYIEYFEDATVRDMIDDCFGDGAAAVIEQFANRLPGLTVKQIADAAIGVSEIYGIDIDEFYALVNGIIYLSMDVEFDIASEIDRRNDYTVAMLVAEIMGYPEGSLADTAEALSAEISEMLALVMDSTVDDLFLLFGAQSAPEDSTDGIEEQEENEILLTDILKGMIATIGEKASLEVVVDKDGNVKSASINVADRVVGSYSADGNGKLVATFAIDDLSFSYVSENGVYSLVVKMAESKIIEGEFSVTEDGYSFDGNIYAGDVTADITADIGLDGTLDLLISAVGGASDVVFSVKYDKENIDVLLKGDGYTMLNLYVDIADGKVVAVDFDIYNKITVKAENAPELTDSELSQPNVDYWHVFGLDYLDNGEGVYSLEILIPEEDQKITAEYDGENFDVVILDDGYTLLSLYVDIADAKIISADLDVRSVEEEKRLKEEYKHLEDIYDQLGGVLPEEAYEAVEVVYHVLALDYADNGDGTYSLVFAVPDEYVVVTLLLDTENKTLDIEAKEADKTLFESVFTLTEDALSMDMTIYTEDVTSDVDIVIGKENFTYTIVLDNQYKILDISATYADGKLTSLKLDANDYYTDVDYYYDSELDEWLEETIVIFEDAVDINYTNDEDFHKIQFNYYGMLGDIIIRTDNKMISAEAVIVYEEPNWEDETAEPIIHTIFDGRFNAAYSYENGVVSVTLSVDVDDFVTEEYDWKEFEDSDDWHIIEIIEKYIYSFDGELTFSFKIAE